MISTLLAQGILDSLGINVRVLGTQVVIFVITFLVLSRILFARVLKHMMQREEEIRKAHELIQQSRAEAEQMAQDYQARITKVDKDAYEKMQEIYRKTLAASAEIVARAQTEAKGQVEQARVEIDREKKAAAAQLRDEVSRLAVGLVEKVIDGPFDRAAHGAAVQKFVSERT